MRVMAILVFALLTTSCGHTKRVMANCVYLDLESKNKLYECDDI